MPLSYFCYVSPTDRCEVLSHYDKATAEAQAGLDTALEYLENLSREKWAHPRTHAARLDKQKWPNFYEIRFKANNVQQRPIGFFGPGDNEFTFVIWCTEKSKLLPDTWFNTANDRRLAILDGTATKKPLYKKDGEK
jgi:hypothetical protein